MRRIFISDLHMGDERSMMKPGPAHKYPYVWLQKNTKYLADFLGTLLQAEDVEEVVVLGDLFDQWVVPTDMAPTQLADICNNPANQGVIDNFKALAGSGRIKLTYVPGNHDMGYCRADLAGRKKFFEETFPGIIYICEDDRPAGVYRSGKLAAEHGNMYCMFNAPDTWTVLDSFLPLGYFEARMVAYKVAVTNHHENYLDILEKLIKEFTIKPDFIEDIFFATADDAGLKKSDQFNMKEISGYPPGVSIKKIGAKYKKLFLNWDKNHKHGSIRSLGALLADAGDLGHAAQKVYFSRSDTNIVIFGHTHKPTMNKHYLTKETLDSKGLFEIPCASIYANSGAWTDQAHVCTYVETEEDPKKKRHYVRVKTYPGNECLHEGFVNL